MDAVLHRVNDSKHDVVAALLAEARRRKVDVIVMEGCGEFRLRERLLGGVTCNLMHEAPVPIVIAH
jgi:nucleotide-binding universal stress UspA family protein